MEAHLADLEKFLAKVDGAELTHTTVATHREGRKLCLCGCGAWANGKKSRFVPGHDAKLKSRLLRNLKDGKDVLDGLNDEQATFVTDNWVHVVAGLKAKLAEAA